MSLVLVALATATGVANVSPVRAADRSRPNVLLIITDDQGYGDFSIHGNPHVQTPHIDRLGESSVRFERFFVNAFCAPTRAALLTGRYSLRTGVYGVTHNKEAMRSEEVTLAEALGASGYRTACIGKWHNGEQYPHTPLGQGFQRVLGFNNGHWNNYFNATLLRGHAHESTRGYISDVLTDEAIAFIERPAETPFFCYLAYNAPHSPFQCPDADFERFKMKSLDDDVAAFYGMCENIDRNVGRLLARLDERGLSRDTIVVFLTDNGGTAGVKLYNAGMRGGKVSMHEGGSRVPLFVRWPAAGWTPHIAAPIVAHFDVLPTLLDLCGVKRPAGPPLDGISLRPLLESTERPATWPERTLFIHHPVDETNRYPGGVRTQQFRLTREMQTKRQGGTIGPWELYDMVADPGETKNLASERTDLVESLARQYEAWYDDVTRDGRRRMPLPVGYAEHNPVELHAPQAYYDAQLKFAAGPGFSNDWLMNWSDANAKIWFDVDVVRAGRFACEIAYACPADDAGSTLRLTAGDRSVSASVPAASPRDIRLPHRDEGGHAKYRNRDWSVLKLGEIDLPAGPHRLAIDCPRIAGREVLEFKHLLLDRVPEPPREKAP